MVASGNYDADSFVSDDLITWQCQGQREPLSRVSDMACAELNELAAALDMLNGLLYVVDAEAFDEDAAVAATIEVARLSMMAAIHILGLIHRSPDGLSVVGVASPSPSPN